MNNRLKYADAEHFVYRLFDATGLCLYVGCTVNVQRRIEEHRANRAPFVADIASIDVSRHPNMDEGRDAESVAILELRPRWNTNGRPPRSEWTACDYFEVIERMTVWPGYGAGQRRLACLVSDFRRHFPDIAAQTLPALGYTEVAA